MATAKPPYIKLCDGYVATIAFFAKYPGWHSYAKDSLTVKSIKWLCQHGFLEINKFRQARHTGKVFV